MLTEQEIRAIVQDELAKNYTSGSPNIAPHEHNGTDGFKLDPVNLLGASSIPSSSQKYLNQDTGKYEYGFGYILQPGSTGHAPQTVHNPTIAMYPIVVIQGNGGGTQSAFNGGYAPDGTMVFFDNGNLLSNLYIRSNGVWRGVNFPLVI